jgi:tyrocidine synthetase-3
METVIHNTDQNNLPLSSNQKRLWILSQQDKSNPAYNIQLNYHFEGKIDAGLVQKSLTIIFNRQHTMFSLFRHTDGYPYITIVPRPIEVMLKDFTEVPLSTRRNEILAFIGEDSRIAFDIENGPLYRIHLLKEDEESWFFYTAVHHLIFDGFSRRLFVQELNAIYTNLLQGVDVQPAPLKFHSYDFAELEKVPLPQEKEKEMVEFWKDNLKDMQPELKFPYDYSRSNEPTGHGFRELFQVSTPCTAKLRELSRQSNSSVFNTLLSTLGLLLQKYTGEDDICIGVPVSGRRSSHSFKMFGMMVNTVGVRLKIDGQKSFSGHIDYTTSAINKVLANSSLPFEKIVDAVNPPRITGINPFFQTSFSWINNLTIPIDFGGVTGKRFTVSKGISPFDLTFYMWENGDCIQGEIEYNSDILKPDTIARLKNHYLNLLHNLTENPEVEVGSVSLISDEERAMISSVNDTATDYSKEKTMIGLFEERVAIDPDNTALISDDGEITFSELNARACRLAGVLRKHNIGKGDYIGLLMRRSPELIISLLAIYKAGAAYIPLNLTDPGNRIVSIIETAGIKIVLTNNDNDTDLAGKCEKHFIEDLLGESAGFPTEFENTRITSADHAYVIFTSGTTGTPKGVLVNHKSAINLIEWVNKTFQVSKSDKLLWVTNLSFDLSVYDIFGILSAGARIRVVSEEDRTDPEKQFRIMLDEGITFWDSAPQSLQQLEPFFGTSGENGLNKSLRLVFLSGDWIPLSLPKIITDAFPSAVVTGLGGATEATVWSNYFIIDQIKPDWKSIPYGKPIQNARYYVLDNELNHCRINQPGNLYIGGECLALGYFNDPLLSDTKFIPDPYNAGGKMYLTGDKAQWMPDGNIEFLGREDEQLKVRGYRVEIGEIKNVVLQNKLIKDAIVIPDKSNRHDIKVILFITTFDGVNLDVRDLKREFRASLPEYMIPAEIVECDEFPATANGKIDSKSLLASYLKSLGDGIKKTDNESHTSSKPMTYGERAVLRIWNEVLPARKIASNDNFFDVGGNSLLAIRVINRIREEFGYILTFRTFLTNPSIEQLAVLVKSFIKDHEKEIKLVHSTQTTNLPLTHNQKRLWLLSRLEPDVPSYIIPFTFRLTGDLNRSVFNHSLEVLFKRHHTLFSSIKDLKGEPYIEIIPEDVRITFVDFSALPVDQKENRIKDVINSDCQIVFDLENGPLYRICLIKTDAREYYFRISIHHIIFDGWSWSVFSKDLCEIYNSYLKGKDPELKPIEFHQYDFAHWEESIAGLRNEEIHEEFWRENLRGASTMINFPYDYPNREKSSGQGRYEPIHISSTVSDKLRAISKSEGTSLFSNLLGAFGILMNKYSGDDDINIGIPLAHRPHSALENILGMFVNTVVVRMKYDKGLTFRDIIRQADNAALNAIAHQELPFESVVEIVNPSHYSKANPLFQVSFVWQNNINTPLELNGIQSSRIVGKLRPVPFDLILYLWENGQEIEGEIGYSIDLFRHDTIERLIENFVGLLGNLVDNCSVPFETVTMISDEEKRHLEEFNNTTTEYPRDRTIIQLFNEQVALYPDKTAIVFKDEKLTYSELDIRSNRLANTLRKSGVSENMPVGIIAEKSVDIIIGIFAILKAGGGYVPVDPDYPMQRINFIIGDSCCKIVLVQDKFANLEIPGVRMISLNSESSFSEDSTAVEVKSTAEDLAYIMYTSGTTGMPKGSMIWHKGVVRLVRNINYMELTSEDRILLTGAIVFDATTFEIWGALLNGGTLYIVEKETILNPKVLGEELMNNDITVLWLTSALFTQIAESRTDIFRKLKYLLSGGDVLSAQHINKVRRDNPSLKVINGYGPTENTTFSTTYLIERDFESNIPIGKPISNSTTYIFDNNMNYQPIGVIGELYVGGDGLSLGYLNRDDLNKKSFIDHPYKPGERLYKTGDHARWLADGNIEFHGRIDNQLKIRGFRVELEEIAAVISELEGVVESVIKPVKVQEGDIRLAAFLNVKETFNIDPKEIARIIKQKLPPYMVPSVFKLMNGFPATINGKTDREALKVDISELITRESHDQQNFSPNEKIIYDIWCESLKITDISANDNFFDIGGNSLMAISVFSKIETAFNLNLKLRVFFDSPRISDLTRTIEIAILSNSGKNMSAGNSSGEGLIDGEI